MSEMNEDDTRCRTFISRTQYFNIILECGELSMIMT